MYHNRRLVSRYFFLKKSLKIGHAPYIPAVRKKLFVPISAESHLRQPERRKTTHLRQPTMMAVSGFVLHIYANIIDFMPFFGQQMSNHRRKCLSWGLIVIGTSFQAGFWCLSLLKTIDAFAATYHFRRSPASFLTLFGLAWDQRLTIRCGFLMVWRGIRTHAPYIPGRLKTRRLR